jgi:hypothetical protein
MLQGQDSAKPQSGWGSPPNPPSPRRKAFRAKLTTVREVQAQLARLYREARGGVIDVQDASRLANILAILGRMMADSDLEARIEALEAQGQ